MNQDEETPFIIVPLDVWILIFGFLDDKSVWTLSFVSQKFHRVSTNNQIWEERFNRIFGGPNLSGMLWFKFYLSCLKTLTNPMTRRVEKVRWCVLKGHIVTLKTLWKKKYLQANNLATCPSFLSLSVISGHHPCTKFLLDVGICPWWDDHHIANHVPNEENLFLNARNELGLGTHSNFTKSSILNYTVIHNRFDSFQEMLECYTSPSDKSQLFSLFTTLCIAAGQGKCKYAEVILRQFPYFLENSKSLLTIAIEFAIKNNSLDFLVFLKEKFDALSNLPPDPYGILQMVQDGNMGDAIKLLRQPTSDGITSIPFEEIKMGDFIASGFFGSVFSGYWKTQKIALKEIWDTFDSKEAKYLSTLHHPNIICSYGITHNKENGQYFLITDLIEGGNVNNLLFLRKMQMSVKQCIKIAYDVAMALDYIFSKNLLHNDVSTNNILLDTISWTAYVCDFGLTNMRYTHVLKNSWISSPNPEADFCDDIYSFGLFMWELFSGITLYEAMKSISGPTKVLQQWVANIKLGNRPLIVGVPTCISLLIQQCWSYDTGARPTISKILSSLRLILVGNENLDQVEFPGTLVTLEPYKLQFLFGDKRDMMPYLNINK